MTISQVARHFGLRASALRYYEQLGLLPAVNRVGGQRRYDLATMRRLAVIQRAREAGFALDEIRELFCGFRPGVPASQRWQQLSKRKLTEIESAIAELLAIKCLLEQMANCPCDALDDCGAALLKAFPPESRRPSSASRRALRPRRERSVRQ